MTAQPQDVPVAPAGIAPESARYGDPDFILGVRSETIDLQLRHRSVRRFLPDPVDDDQLRAVVAAAQSAPTSSNLQAWSVVAVRDVERKARLATLAANQRFIEQAPLFLVWLADLGRARRLADRADGPLAAESIGLGTVYVGGIRNHPVEVARELDLPPHTFAVFGLALGTPDPDEPAGVKPRLPQTSVLHHETYTADSADDGLERYDERLRQYNAAFGISGSWTDRVLARLAGPQSMAGRHTIRDSLASLGFPAL